jgi:hypothetical protein
MRKNWLIAILSVTLAIALTVSALWFYQRPKNSERDAYIVLDRTGAPVPEKDLAWVQTIANTLDQEADDRWLQERIHDIGLHGAYSTIQSPAYGYGALYAVFQQTPTVFPVQTPSGTYYVNRDGTLILRPPNDFHIALPYHEGLAVVGSITVIDRTSSSDRPLRYIDKQGETVIPGPFVRALPFSNGIAVVSVRTQEGDIKYGTIDKTGTWQIEPKFDLLFEFVEGLAAAQIDNPDHPAKIAGFVDHSGEFVVTLDKVQRMQSSHHDGMALVWRTEPPEYIYVDRSGETVLTPDYQQVEPFYEGRAAFLVEDSWGYMDLSGKQIIPPEYFGPLPFDNGIVALIKTPEVMPEPIVSWVIEYDENGNEIVSEGTYD